MFKCDSRMTFTEKKHTTVKKKPVLTLCRNTSRLLLFRGYIQLPQACYLVVTLTCRTGASFFLELHLLRLQPTITSQGRRRVYVCVLGGGMTNHFSALCRNGCVPRRRYLPTAGTRGAVF